MTFVEETKFQTQDNSLKRFIVPGLIFVAVILSFFLVFQSEDTSEFPEFVTDAFTFTAWVNQGEDFLKVTIKEYTRAISAYVKAGYFMLEDFLLDSSCLLATWWDHTALGPA